MKKKVRNQQAVPFYSSEPAVARNKMADAGMSPNANLGTKTPKMVDKSPGRLSGVAGFASKSAPSGKKTGVSIPKLGAKSGPPQQGNLRASGHSGAHRVGAGLKKV